jgi:hypothetical protein
MTNAARPWAMARRAERLNPSTIREILKLTERPGIISLAGGQMQLQGVAHGVALGLVARPDARHMLLQEAVLDDLVRQALIEDGRVQVSGLFGLQQLGEQRRWRHHITQPQTGRQDLGEGPQVNRPIAHARGHGRRWRSVKPEVAVRVVFDDGQAQRERPFGQGGAT